MSRCRHLVKSRFLRQTGTRDAVSNAAAVVTLSETDANAARFIYGLEARRVYVVSNGVNESFFQASPEPWRRKFGAKPFVLCVGAIQKRKNQLLLTEACNRLRLPVVLLGPVLPGEREYGDRVRIAIETNTALGGQWISNLRNEDELLTSAFAACQVFALLSSTETQPLSVMQAMAARRPVLLLRAGYCQDHLFRTLPTVDSAECNTVVDALKDVFQKKQVTELSHEYTWEQVARRLLNIYQSAAA